LLPDHLDGDMASIDRLANRIDRLGPERFLLDADQHLERMLQPARFFCQAFVEPHPGRVAA
jgi:hypothetical protein